MAMGLSRYWFTGLAPEGLNAHLQHLSRNLADQSSIEIELGDDVCIPVTKETYVRKADTVSVLIRATEIGREALETLYNNYQSEGAQIRVRRSAKKKLLNRFTVVLSTEDSMYPTKVVSILEQTTLAIGRTWPIEISVGYMVGEFDPRLPGQLTSNSFAWRAGQKVGKFVGSIMNGFKNAI